MKPLGKQALKGAIAATGAIGMAGMLQSPSHAFTVNFDDGSRTTIDFEGPSSGFQGDSLTADNIQFTAVERESSGRELAIENTSVNSTGQFLETESDDTFLGFETTDGSEIVSVETNYGIDDPNLDAEDDAFARLDLMEGNDFSQSGGSAVVASNAQDLDNSSLETNPAFEDMANNSISVVNNTSTAATAGAFGITDGDRIVRGATDPGESNTIDAEERVDAPFGFSPSMGLGALGLLYGGVQLRRRWRRQQTI